MQFEQHLNKLSQSIKIVHNYIVYRGAQLNRKCMYCTLLIIITASSVWPNYFPQVSEGVQRMREMIFSPDKC
jgi:hypothetical protein